MAASAILAGIARLRQNGFAGGPVLGE